MESKETRDKCEKCKEDGGSRCLCHCKLADISDTMRTNCSQAWRKHLQKKDAQIDVEGEGAVENETQTAFNSRVEKFKLSVAKRSSLYGGKKVVAPAQKDRDSALESRKRRIENEVSNNNTSKGAGGKKVKKKVPVRKSRDNESDKIADL